MPPKPSPMTPLSQRLREKLRWLRASPANDYYVMQMTDDMELAADTLDALAALRPEILTELDVEPYYWSHMRKEALLKKVLALLPEEGR